MKPSPLCSISFALVVTKRSFDPSISSCKVVSWALITTLAGPMQLQKLRGPLRTDARFYSFPFSDNGQRSNAHEQKP